MPDEIIKDVIDALAKLGNVWLVFDNFESVLLHNHIKENQLCAFFEKGLQTNGLHFLLTSQKVPEFAVPAEIKELEIGDLPDDFALEFLQTQGAKLKDEKIDCGLAETTLEDLHKLKELGFVCVPMALVALVGYLKANSRKYGETMAQVVENRQLFAKFREHDAKDPKEGSMYLIERQYLALTAAERLVLKAVSIFPNAVAFAVLLEILNEHLDEDTIFGVLTGNTLVRRIGANSYELLPQANEVISKQSDQADEKLTVRQLHLTAAKYYLTICQPISECYTPEQFAPYFSAIDHSIKAEIYDMVVQIFNKAMERLVALGYMQKIIGRCRQVVGKLSEPEVESDNFVNLGMALSNLGRLNEAVVEYDKAIMIREELVHEKRRVELAKDLAGVYVNKGNALQNLGRLDDAFIEVDKALAIYEKLVKEQKRIELANDLASAYESKSNNFLRFGRLNEAIAEIDKAIAIYEDSVYEKGRIKLINRLAMAYVNKGISLTNLGRWNEAIAGHDKAIAILQELVYEKGQIELSNYLATVYLNKGGAFWYIGKWNEAVAEFDKAIAIREELVYEKGRIELANDLAMAYLNKGSSLSELGNLYEAIAENDKAISIFEELVNGQGRIELVSELAKTYMNKGIALASLGRLNESIPEFDKAILIYENLVKEKRRIELVNDLAKAYMNKGRALKNIPDLDNSLVCFNVGILLWEQCLSRDDIQVLPHYIQGLTNRVEVLTRLEDWQRTADDVVNAFDYISLLEKPEVPDFFKQRIGGEILNIIQNLKEISPEKREEIYKYAGEDGEMIRRNVEGN